MQHLHQKPTNEQDVRCFSQLLRLALVNISDRQELQSVSIFANLIPHFFLHVSIAKMKTKTVLNQFR